MLIKIKYIFIILLFATPAWATDYYVDNTCGENGNGTTQTCGAPNGPFNSLANAQSGLTGNQSDNRLLFKKGQTFSGQFTVGAYGTADHVFTISSYGTGADPIISGGNNNIFITGKSYIVIDGLTLTGATYEWGCGVNLWDSCTHVTIQNCTITYSNYNGVQAEVNSDYSIIRNNTIYGCKGYGIAVGGTAAARSVGHQIYGNNCYNNSSGFYPVRMDDSVIYENLFHDNDAGYNEEYGIGILACSNNEFYDNLIYNNNNMGVQFYGGNPVGDYGPCNNNKFYRNIIWNHTEGAGHGLNFGTNPPRGDWCQGNEVYHNIIFNNTKGFQVDYQFTNNYFYNNIIYGSTNNGVQFDGTGSISWTFKNNIFVENTPYDLNMPNVTSMTHSNNLYYRAAGGNRVYFNSTTYDATTVKSTFEPSCQNTDPLFVEASPSNWYDFRLSSGSPAIGTGATLDAAYDDALSPTDIDWPPSTLDQDDYAPWEIGAFIFLGGTIKGVSIN